MKLPVGIAFRALFHLGFLSLAGLWIACSGPIVARSPEALFAHAQEQIANGRYHPAVDSLNRAFEQAPDSPSGRRAQLLRLGLLGGMARAYQDLGESYLEGHRQAGEASHAARMRSLAMDYFGRVRGLGTDFVEALDSNGQGYLEDRFALTYVPEQVVDGNSTLERVQAGDWVEEDERELTERAKIAAGLAQTLKLLAGNRTLSPELEYEPAAVVIGTARHLLQLSSAFGPEALDDPSMYRHFHRRALAAAKQAAELAKDARNFLWQKQAKEVERHCQRVLERL